MEISGWSLLCAISLMFLREQCGPAWSDHYDLTFQPIFNAAGGRLVGQPSSSLWWERIQKNLQPDGGQTLLSV